MKVVRFLENENVIKIFGVLLIITPFINTFLNFYILKNHMGLDVSQIDLFATFKKGDKVYYFLSICSIAIGIPMVRGSKKSWTYVLVLIGSLLVSQILDLNKKSWVGPLAWPSFLMNLALFVFILDQLVWKVYVPPAKEVFVINLNSYRRILFSFGAKKPWGQLKTLSSVEMMVKSFALVPPSVENETIQIQFAKDLIIEVVFKRRDNEKYYFKPLNMHKENVDKLNTWLRKIAA